MTPDSDPRPDDTVRVDDATSDLQLEQVGPYRLIEPLGEGGMGIVYLARQTEPVTRDVALKVIKLGMDTKQVIARFEAERQALAMMNHPGIAKVLDAGSTAQGRPYFVMELVRGEAITDYCDRHNLATRERLALFIDVCHAVQHAHQKGIIHRDLKPSNILVSVDNDRPLPRVIDFGIAKATTAQLTDKTVVTEYRQIVGTPAYMSPEQAEMSNLDIDTRSDIYALGVLLYELLTGSTPFDAARLADVPYAELQRIIREEDPPRPSTRLSTLGASLTDVARHRRVEPALLTRAIRGDLDWIVMRAIEKDRTRRYDTADALAHDIRRYLSDEPVLASPPSTTYRMRKLIRRNRGVFIGATLVTLALVLGFIGTAGGLVRAIRAEKAMTELATEAQRQAAIAKAVSTFLSEDILESVKPSGQPGMGRDARMIDVLAAASTRIEAAGRPGGKFADEPLIEASIRSTIGNTYRALGRYPEAERHIQRAIDLITLHRGPEDPMIFWPLNNLAFILSETARPDQARALNEHVLELRRRALGPEHPDTLVSMGNLAGDLHDARMYDDAVKLDEEVFEIRARTLGEENRHTLASMNNLAVTYLRLGRLDEARDMAQRAIDIESRLFGADDPATLRTMHTMATILRREGRDQESLALNQRIFDMRMRVLGEDHPDTLKSMSNIANSLVRLGRADEAVEWNQREVEATQRIFGDAHPDTRSGYDHLGLTYMDLGRIEDADRVLSTAVDLAESAGDREGLAESLHHLAEARFVLGHHDEAVAMAVRSVEMYRADDDRGGEHFHAEYVLQNLLVALERTDDLATWSPGFLEWLREASDEDEVSADELNNAAYVLMTIEPSSLQDSSAALEYATRAVDLAPNEPAILDTLAYAQFQSGDAEAAVETITRALSMVPANDPERAYYEEQLAIFRGDGP